MFKIEFSLAPSAEEARAFLQMLDDSLSEMNIEWHTKRGINRLKSPVLQVMRAGWYDRGKEKLVASGKRLFQAKTIILDSKAVYQPEPEETDFEVGLEP